MVRALPHLVLLAVLAAACSPQGPVDLAGLEGRARGGDAAAFRELVQLLGREENQVNSRAYAVVMDLGKAAVPYLLEKVETKDRHAREHILAALGTLKVREAIPSASRVLGDRTLKRRYIAAWALGEIGDPAGIPALIAALDDPEVEVCKFATRSLIKLNRPAVEPLLSYLERSEGEGRLAAIRALGDIGDLRALPALLARKAGDEREEVFLALGKLKDPRAEAVLIAGLDDPDWRVRMNAAMALGPLGGEEAVAPLEATLEDGVHVVREWSARSLEMITGRHITYRNEEGEYVAPYNIYH